MLFTRCLIPCVNVFGWFFHRFLKKYLRFDELLVFGMKGKISLEDWLKILI